MKLNLQLFGGRGQSKGGKRLTLSQRQKEAGERLTRNAEKGAMSDIKTYLDNGGAKNVEERKEFIRELASEWNIEESRAKELYQNVKNEAKVNDRINWFKRNGVEVKNSVPKGYTKLEGSTTAPNGYEWYSNGKPRFSGEYKSILVKKKK